MTFELVGDVSPWAILTLFGFGFFGGIFGFITTLFGIAGRVIVDVIRAVTPIVRDVWQGLRSVINRVSDSLVTFAKTVPRWARGLYELVVKRVVPQLVQWYNRFKNFLQQTLRPVFDIIERVAEALDWVYERIVAPILTYLEKASAVFRALEQMGFEWAGAIRELIDKVGGQIERQFEQVVNHFNNFTDLLNDLLDPAGFIKAQPWFTSVSHWGGGTIALLVSLGEDPLQDVRDAVAKNALADTIVPSSLREPNLEFVLRSPSVQRAVAEFNNGTVGTGPLA